MNVFPAPAFWLAAYAGLVTLPLVALVVGERPAHLGVWWDASMGAGFAALSLMAVQFLLTARFKRAAAPFGIDILYYFHRYLAYLATAALSAHLVIVFVENPALTAYLDPRVAPLDMTFGVMATASVLVLMVTSVLRKRLRIEYDVWRRLHLLLAVSAIAGGLLHIRGVAYYSASPVVGGLWILIAASLAVLSLYVRVWRPWRLSTRPYRVASVTAERGDAWTLALEPLGHQGLQFTTGQFVWLTLGHSPFAMREHPFSISSAPDDRGTLEVTVKALGDFTARIGSVAVGSRAHVDGPYGSFSIDRHPAVGYVFIAGGIGIAPIMSFLRTLAARGDRRPVLLVYAYRRHERLTFREAIDALATVMPLTVVIVLDEPPEAWPGERGRITGPLLERHLPPRPDRAAREYFVCGPTAMIESVERDLVGCGVPLRRVRSEIFDLA